MDYTNKVVLVTGGAKGIGKAITLEYCRQGATVIFCDNDEEAGATLQERIKEVNGKGSYYKIDLEDVLAIEKMVQYILSTVHKIDILINNAGIFEHKSICDMTIRDWDRMMNVNLRSMFFCSKEFIKSNPKTAYGRIINITSTRQKMSEGDTEAYAASKGGIFSLTHALAVSLSGTSIRVNSISPGWIETQNYDTLRTIDHRQHPSNRVGKPEDIAQACLFFTDEKNDFINGENLVIDGGMTRKMIYEP